MRLRLHPFAAVSLALPLVLLANQAVAADIGGYWLKRGDYGNSAVIQIAPSGNGFDGRIVAVERTTFAPGDKAEDGEPVPPDRFGAPKTDLRNPDPNLRAQRIKGLEIIHGFRLDGANVWTGASIYNPEDGKTYQCKATLSEDGQTLTVRGYVMLPLIGKTQRWTRLDSPAATGWPP